MFNLQKKIGVISLIVLLVFWTVSPAVALAASESGDADSQSGNSNEEIVSNQAESDEGANQTSSDPQVENSGNSGEESEGEGEVANIKVNTGEAKGFIETNNNVNINETEIGQNDGKDSEENPATGDDESVVQSDESGDSSNSEANDADNTLDDNSEVSDQSDMADESQDDQDQDNDAGCSEPDCKTDQEQVDIDNDNQAEVDSDIDADLNSGDNEVSDNLANIDLTTGDIQLISNIFNLINFNVVGSDYLKAAYSLVGNIIGDLDLSGFSLEDLADIVSDNEDWQALASDLEDGEAADDNSSQSLDDEDLSGEPSISIDNNNEADVQNNVLLDLTSGLNEVSDNAGNIKVVTGNISVVSNMVNIVNTNIVGDGWTLAIINIVGGWDGDLVLPSLTSYIASQTDDFSLTCSDYECLNAQISNINQASVSNEVNINVNSGDNSVENNGGQVTVKTGDTAAFSNLYNQVNTNINKSNWVYGTINVMGDWLGGFYGQPEAGFEVIDDNGSVVFMYNPEIGTVDDNSTKEDNAGEEEVSASDNSEEDDGSDGSGLSIKNNNKAKVSNIVDILANSGGNSIQGNAGNVDLKTGDVFALSNILNLVNTNITGSDWTLATINIIGDWNGSVYFGKPDLQIFEVATPADDPVRPGSIIDYVLTVTNKGDAAANDVEIRTKLDPNLVRILDNGGGVVDGDSLVWKLDSIGVGEIANKHYRIQIVSADDIDNMNIDQPTVFSLSKVNSLESDRNPEDNSAENHIAVGGTGAPLINGYGFPVQASLDNTNANWQAKQEPSSITTVYSDLLEIEKSNNSDGLIKQGQSVVYTIKLYNNSDITIRDVYVFDVMYGPDDDVLNEQYWALGDVLPHEEITIDYTNVFAEDAPYGTYKNQTWADGFLDDSTYLVFPKKNNLIVIREPLDPASVRVSVDYEAKFVKTKGASDEDYLIIKNEGETGLPEGRVVLMYDSDYIEANGERNGSSFVTPSVNPGESVRLPINISALQAVERAQLDFAYLLDNSPVVQGTVFYSIVPDSELPNSSSGLIEHNNPHERLQNSADVLQEKDSSSSPKVLGVSEAFAGLSPMPAKQLFGNKLDIWLKDDWRILLAWVTLLLIIIWLSWWNKRLSLNKAGIKKRK